MPADLSMDLVLNTLHTRWGNAQGGEIRASSSLPSRENFQLFKSNVVWPERLANLPFQATAEFTNLDSTQIDLKNISLHLESRAPQITFDSSGRTGDGNFNLNGQLDTSTREVSFAGSSRIDPRKMASLLSTNSQRSLANYSFESPPALEAQGRLILPAWTNRHPDWKGETMPSMVLAGRFEAGPGSYRGVPFSSAQSPFCLTNLLWQLPSLKLTRPEGSLEAEYSSHPLTRDFHWRVRSQIDPLIAKPLFQNEMTKRALDFFQFTTPPAIQADIWGNWGDADRLGAVAQVAATNFAFRGEAVKDCQTRLHYTNKVFVFTECRLQRERGEQGVLQGITLDLGAQKIYLTNGFSTLDPYAVARAISKPAIAAIAPYQFDSPPTIRFDGDIDLKRHRYEEDMHFAVFGNQFHWQQFHLEQLLGKVDWVGQTVTLTNMVGSLKTGRLAGDARFDFTRSRQADFTLKTIFEKADLREIAAPFSGKTNKLEGVLSGELFVTRANTGDSRTWQGVGRLNLQDGLIWDIPMFGLFSPILNGFLPGLGNSRANEADATFILTNGVFVSKDLEIHATMMRMQFKGAVGLNRRVDARVEAELLRDLPAIGVVISKVFWPVTKLFEYKVTGTLSEPKAEPLYILPKILLMPFHPFKALKNMLNEEPKEEEKKPAP